MKYTVWKDSCRSWYKNNETGRVNAVFPGSSLHYQKLIGVPRYEDFEIQRFGKNPWEFLGLGFTHENRVGVEKADCSPYLSAENIDPKWWKARGGSVEALKKAVEEEREKRSGAGGVEWIERRF